MQEAALARAGIVVLVYFSSALNPPPQAQDAAVAGQVAYSHVKQGITAACLVFLGAQHMLPCYAWQKRLSITTHVAWRVCNRAEGGAQTLLPAGYSFLQGPSTSMVRPHPGFWRIVHGVVILYLLALVFLLFQNVDDARQLLKASGCCQCQIKFHPCSLAVPPWQS